MSSNAVRILGIDASLRSTGIGVIDSDGGGLRVVQFGIIKNNAGLSHEDCAGRIYDGIQKIITDENPVMAAIEGVFYCKNVKTAVTLGEARGAILAALSSKGLKVCEYSPRRVKQAVVGYGGADKEQVKKMVVSMLGLNVSPPHDASDALAVAICHAHNLKFSEMIRQA